MNFTQELLTELKAAKGLPSDNQLSKYLGVTKQAVSRYQSGKMNLGQETAYKVANGLGKDPIQVVAKLELEGAKSNEARHIWTRILDMSKTMPALALLGLAVVLPIGNEVLRIV